MLRKPIEYTDFEGNSHTEDFYFHLSMTEFTKLQLGTVGGYQGYLRRLLNAENIPELTEVLDTIVLSSYGEKSPDGKRFIKIAPDGHKLSDDFKQSAAYDALFMELLQDDKKVAEFLDGILPKELADKVKEAKSDPEFLALQAKYEK